MQVQQVTAQILQGDALEMLRTLTDESVQCVVTSPPYYGLRDYGTSEWGGGDPAHEHDTIAARGGRGGSGAPGKQTEGAFPSALPANQCKCGATRIDSQIGLEPSPAAYIAKLVAVFAEVRRVLRKDGVAWVNMGDSYAGSWGAQSREHSGKHAANVSALSANQVIAAQRRDGNTGSIPLGSGLKPKDLMGMPWRLAFALQADGWYLRQDIIWAKPNPMPESVTDRCTKSHEYIFLLSKSERYFYDADAVRESHDPRWEQRRGTCGMSEAKYAAWQDGAAGIRDITRYSDGVQGNPAGRNKRSVWTLTTEPYPEAHFATFPTELPRICILAGSRVGDTILDPFAGSGTTLQVALELSRAAIGIELNAEYVALANRRLNSTTLGLPLEAAA